MRRIVWLAVLGLGCADPADGVFGDGSEIGGARFDVDGAFWASPFPSDHRVDADSRRVDLEGFPNPGDIDLVGRLVTLLDDQVQGWSVSGALYIPFDRALSDAHLPTLDDSVASDAAVYLVDVDEDPEGRGTRVPIHVAVRDGPSTFGPQQAVMALPLQGRPLAPRRRHALVVKRRVRDAEGIVLGASEVVQTLLAGELPDGWRQDVADQYRGALTQLEALGEDLSTIAGLTVFTTGRPTRGWHDLVATARADKLLLVRSPELLEVFDDYCVYQTLFEAPIYQAGEPPYSTEGGGFVFDDDGELVVQRRQRARLFLNVPRVQPTEVKRPTVVFIRTGGGGDRPLMDRGVRDAEGVAAPGSGYAATFARAGWASVMVDGPLGGPLRNPSGADEQFLIFNVANPVALRDTLRQSALELALVPDVLKNMIIPGGSCPGLSPEIQDRIQFDSDHLALFGHSMGATIAPLVAAAEPRYRGVILSGAGGSWIDNVLHKQSPLAVRPLAATMIGESVEDLDAFHPVLTLLQWAGEPADPPMYADQLVLNASEADAQHVLMVQGLRDTYILPPIANALSLSLGLDLAGPVLDDTLVPEFAGLTERLRWSGGQVLPLPAGLNRGTPGDRNVTAVVVQHQEDGIEDGHEVVFQLPTPHHQVSCFLRGLVDDTPVVPGEGVQGDPCPDPPGEQGVP